MVHWMHSTENTFDILTMYHWEISREVKEPLDGPVYCAAESNGSNPVEK